MKWFAMILIVLCLAALAGVWYVHVTSSLNVFPVSCVATDPVSHPELFEKIKSQLENDTFAGTRFSKDPLTTPDQYIIYTWTVRLDNNTSLDARAAEIRISPKEGYDIIQFEADVLQAGRITEHVVPANSSAEFTVSVLASRKILDAVGRPDVRDATVTWYFAGLPFPENSGNSGKVILSP